MNEKLQAAKYLVCVDNRAESHTALRLAGMKAAARGGKVRILHATPPADFQTLGAIADRMREERRKEGEQLLQELAQEAHAAFGVQPELLLREGAPGDVILETALEDPHITMLVIGIAQQGAARGKLASWLAGQLGQKLLVPLLMVPGNLTDQQLEALI